MSLLYEMALHFGVGVNDLAKIVSTAPLRYKVYGIAKRRGGVRIIAQPSSELKALQRYVLEMKLPAFPVHPAAAGYVRGRNILSNAQAHLANKVILKLDFKDFFPSIKVSDWEKLVRTTIAVNRSDLSVYSKIMFWGQGSRVPKCLSIGAPTSPALSNIILFKLDVELAKRAANLGVVYTRYADDRGGWANLNSPISGFPA
jgi:RNA-directed DNA polymerase